MLEKEVETPVDEYAKKKGCMSVKLNGLGNRGKPDRMWFYRGRVLILEAKAPGEEPTTKQWGWINKFKAAGFDSGYFNTVGKGKTMVDEFIAKTDAEFIGDMFDDL